MSDIIARQKNVANKIRAPYNLPLPDRPDKKRSGKLLRQKTADKFESFIVSLSGLFFSCRDPCGTKLVVLKSVIAMQNCF